MISILQMPNRAVWNWALYDFANSAFPTLVGTFIYATYFTQAIAPDPIRGTALWSQGITLSAIIIALLSPPLGVLADQRGYRGELLLGFTIACIVMTAALFFVEPGQVFSALLIYIIASVSFELANVFYNAYLPELAPAGKIGWISGFGWALGYVGGLLALVVALLTLVQPDVPWFGFDKINGENIRASNLLAALWFAVFSLPLLLQIKRAPKHITTESNPDEPATLSMQQLLHTLAVVLRYRQTVRFLLARMLYIDALITVFAFGGIYAAGTLGFDFHEILLFGIVLNICAGLGAFALGFVDDWLGAKRTIQISLLGLIAATLLATFAEDKAIFWAAGIVIGLFSGPVQSASRSLMGRFAPPSKRNEFFGFFAFAGKATAFLGPLLFGAITAGFANQRGGVAMIAVLFFIGLVTLTWVNEKEGVAQAVQEH